jgi:hypothetical protein
MTPSSAATWWQYISDLKESAEQYTSVADLTVTKKTKLTAGVGLILDTRQNEARVNVKKIEKELAEFQGKAQLAHGEVQPVCMCACLPVFLSICQSGNLSDLSVFFFLFPPLFLYYAYHTPKVEQSQTHTHHEQTRTHTVLSQTYSLASRHILAHSRTPPLTASIRRICKKWAPCKVMNE